MTMHELLYVIGALAVGAVLVAVMRSRKRSHKSQMQELAKENVCPHLRPALLHLLEQGRLVQRVGQKSPEMPLEIHLSAPFDPQSIYDELHLEEPVFVSERNVLYCKEDWCEIHPSR